MISKQDLQRLLQRPENGTKVVSIYLDMSVNSDNKRTHQIFLNQKKAEFDELDSDRPNHHREAIGRVFAQVDEWLESDFQEQNRGVVIYSELEGDWFEALQFPVPVQNRFVVGGRPTITPLAEVIESYHHHGVILLDQEHVRILSVYLGSVLDEIEVHRDPLPTARDVQPGGFSQQRFQRRKREEIRHFFRDFSEEVERFVKRFRPDDLIILGTGKNVAKFQEFLSEDIRKRIVHTGSMEVDENAPEVLQKLEPHLRVLRERERQEAITQLRGRLQQHYLASAGVQATLTALQEGKVETLIISKSLERQGARCESCGFVFGRRLTTCSFCGSSDLEDIDAGEEMVRMAEGQNSEVEFVDHSVIADLRGAGALLRF